MGRALSRDLRDRVVAAIEGGMSRRAAAERFGVSAASAIRWRQLVVEQGTPAAKRFQRGEVVALDQHVAPIRRGPVVRLGRRQVRHPRQQPIGHRRRRLEVGRAAQPVDYLQSAPCLVPVCANSCSSFFKLQKNNHAWVRGLESRVTRLSGRHRSQAVIAPR